MTKAEGAVRGLLIGALNAFAVAIAIGVFDGDREAIALIAIFGCFPGLVAGALIGALAGAISDRSPLVRASVLAIPAFGLVFVLDHLLPADLLGPASIPTFLSVWVLERITRKRVAPSLPPARAM